VTKSFAVVASQDTTKTVHEGHGNQQCRVCNKFGHDRPACPASTSWKKTFCKWEQTNVSGSPQEWNCVQKKCLLPHPTIGSVHFCPETASQSRAPAVENSFSTKRPCGYPVHHKWVAMSLTNWKNVQLEDSKTLLTACFCFGVSLFCV
jgi:hypothetical protein